jgi:hypothetical protein
LVSGYTGTDNTREYNDFIGKYPLATAGLAQLEFMYMSVSVHILYAYVSVDRL